MRKRNLLKNVTGKKRKCSIKAFLMVVIFFLGTFGLNILTSHAAVYRAVGHNQLVEQYSDYNIFNVNKNDSVKPGSTNLERLLKEREEIKLKLIKEVDKYIDGIFPKSKMEGVDIVTACIAHNFDIPLLMSQAQRETGFGTAGIGKSRNSCFGVIKGSYKNTNEAIYGYIELMRRSYLPESRSLDDLFASNFLRVTGKGRYAGASGYGKAISKTRNDIINKTQIKSLWDEYQNLDRTIKKVKS